MPKRADLRTAFPVTHFVHAGPTCLAVGPNWTCRGGSQALGDKGIASLAQLGFAAGTPGTTDETSLRAWAGETLTGLTVPAGQEMTLRRLLFTAHTLIIASLKKEAARASLASEVVRKLPPLEREARLTEQDL